MSLSEEEADFGAADGQVRRHQPRKTRWEQPRLSCGFVGGNREVGGAGQARLRRERVCGAGATTEAVVRKKNTNGFWRRNEGSRFSREKRGRISQGGLDDVELELNPDGVE